MPNKDISLGGSAVDALRETTQYPISVSRPQEKISEFFERLLRFHIPQGRIWDPTCGMRRLWEGIDTSPWVVTFSDIRDMGQEVICDFRDFEGGPLFDGIVFDPPYFWGTLVSQDPRRDEYGGYHQTLDELRGMMRDAQSKFSTSLNPGGRLILKCGDMYHPASREFYPLHIEWVNLFRESFKLVDIFIYIYHRVSPTAYQVKQRSCSIIRHTYFLIFSLNTSRVPNT